MKRLLFSSVLLGLVSISFAQTTLFSAKLKKEKVPTVIIESLEVDFPTETVTEYYGIPVEVIDDVWYVKTNNDTEDTDFDTYSVVMKTKNGSVHANYDKDGNLISKHEVTKDAALPKTIRDSIAKHFPGYAPIGDKVILTSYKGGRQKVLYKVHLENAHESFKAVLDSNGNLINDKNHKNNHKGDHKKADKKKATRN